MRKDIIGLFIVWVMCLVLMAYIGYYTCKC